MVWGGMQTQIRSLHLFSTIKIDQWLLFSRRLAPLLWFTYLQQYENSQNENTSPYFLKINLTYESVKSKLKQANISCSHADMNTCPLLG